MKEIKLFDYQEDMKGRIEEALCLHRSVMVQMPTGTGKTHLLASIVKGEGQREKNPRVWIVAHRRELVGQINETLARYGISPEDKRVKAMSVQWLSRHYDEMEEEPGMIVIDEAHHAIAATYQEMWERYPGARFLGLTATPCRLSGKGFTDLFDVLVQSWSILEFICKGRLATYDFVSIKSDGVTQQIIDSLRKRGADGDYQNKEMDMLLNKQPSIERLYRSFEEYGKDRKGIVYAINISHARKIAEFYRQHGVEAVAIDSKTPAAERQADIEAFRKGNIQVMVNVDIFSEGFDCPDVEFVQLARPTISLAKYLQMVGRGLRVAKGKRCCVMIDNVGLYRVFGLPSQVWNWKAMFEGTLKVGRRKECSSKEKEFFLVEDRQENLAEGKDSEMEVVMRHEELLQSQPYREIVDSQGDFAIVKLPTGKLTVVNRRGDQVVGPDNYQDMKLLKGNILFYRPKRKSVCYFDLLARSEIYEGTNPMGVPGVVTLAGWDFIQIGEVYMSRTHEYFGQPFRPDEYALHNHGYCLIYDRHVWADNGCQVWESCGDDGEMCWVGDGSECVCFLRGDHVHVYWLCASLGGDGIVVMDSKEDYYLVEPGLRKTYIGCNHPKDDQEDLSVVMPRLGRQLYAARMRCERQKEEKTRQRLHERSVSGKVERYQAGKRWGIKVDGRVVVPPVYLRIASPVGIYCAFEQMPRHWGVMTLDGKVVVEAKYEKVEVTDDHTAVVTTITGKRQTICLGNMKI